MQEDFERCLLGPSPGQRVTWQGRLPVSGLQGWPTDWAPLCTVQVPPAFLAVGMSLRRAGCPKQQHVERLMEIAMGC